MLPPQRSGKGRPMRDHRQVVEGVIYRYRCGVAWRDLPGSFGPWQTVWKRHRRFSEDGTWDKTLAALLAQADAAREIDRLDGERGLHHQPRPPAREEPAPRAEVSAQHL